MGDSFQDVYLWSVMIYWCWRDTKLLQLHIKFLVHNSWRIIHSAVFSYKLQGMSWYKIVYAFDTNAKSYGLS